MSQVLSEPSSTLVRPSLGQPAWTTTNEVVLPTESSLAKLLSSPKIVLAIIAAVTVLAIALGGLAANRDVFDPDEEIYHRVIGLFGEGVSLDLVQSYRGEPASPAPLFFLVYAWWGDVFGHGYSQYRALSLALTLLAMVFLCLAHSRQMASRDTTSFPLLVFLYPYTFAMAFAVMAEPLTLLLTVIGLLCFHRGLEEDSDVALALGALAITGALYVRIHALFAVGALAVIFLLRKERSPWRWFLVGLPILARLPLVALQGGLTVSREAFLATRPELGFTPSNLHFGLVWLGYSFFPLLWWCSGNRRVNGLCVLLSAPLYFLAVPDFLGMEHNGALRTLLLSLRIDSASAQWLLFPAWCLGCYLAADLMQRIISGRNLREMFYGSAVLLFLASLTFSTVAFERYYVLVVPALVLMGVSRSSHRTGYWAVAACHVLFLGLSAARLGKMLF